jgi:hypothetical protein
MQIIKLDKNELKVLKEIKFPKGIKCATFGASKRDPLQLALGGFEGELNVIDLES